VTAMVPDVGIRGGPRIMFYAHDGMGLGHSRRNLAIAKALVAMEPRASVLMASSVELSLLADAALPIDVLRLPGIAKRGQGRYGSRRLLVSDEDVFGLRADLLRAAVGSFRPDVLVVDRHPLGINGELEPALEVHRARGGRALLGLRDILDEPARVRAEWGQTGMDAAIDAYFQQVLVYGCREILDPVREYELASGIASMVRFCGYVVDQGPAAPAAHARVDLRPTVLATAGGGEDGAGVLEAFLDASAGAPWEAIAVAGPHCPPEDLAVLKERGEVAGAQVIRAAHDMPALLSSSDVAVCMGGYNTLVEALASGASTVCIPRTEPRAEQLIRARAFERRRLLRMLWPDAVSASALHRTIRRALEDARTVSRADRRLRTRRVLDLGGAERAARSVAEAA
jgi:predicted glycosyltransferase